MLVAKQSFIEMRRERRIRQVSQFMDYESKRNVGLRETSQKIYQIFKHYTSVWTSEVRKGKYTEQRYHWADWDFWLSIKSMAGWYGHSKPRNLDDFYVYSECYLWQLNNNATFCSGIEREFSETRNWIMPFFVASSVSIWGCMTVKQGWHGDAIHNLIEISINPSKLLL